MIELVRFTKSGGALTKRITLNADGTVTSDGSACIMAHGTAQRVHINGTDDLAALIKELDVNQAIGLGRLRQDLPNEVDVVTKSKLNGGAAVISRTNSNIVYADGAPGFVLFDYDAKGVTTAVKTAFGQRGGTFWKALCSVLPELATVARVVRRSTSSGLSRSDTGERFPDSVGLHVYAAVQNCGDVERFLRVLHERCWLAGLGWYMVGAGGQLLDRSIVDRMVGAPERLVFEGGPVLDPPLVQSGRDPWHCDGETLDTLATCPPLTINEKSQLREIKARAAHALAFEQARARTDFINKRAPVLAKRVGITVHAAKRVLTQQCDGLLLPSIELEFDDPTLAGCTVADVLADPERFDGATLADPLEGVAYGVGKAKIMRRADGTLWIHSFAHGRTVYELKYDARAVRALIDQAEAADVMNLLLSLLGVAELNAAEVDELRNVICVRTGANKTSVNQIMKQALTAQASQQKRAAQQRHLAARRDPRPIVECPAVDAPWLPVMKTINEIITGAASVAKRPEVRDIEAYITKAARFAFPSTHAFAAAATPANKSSLPPPEQWGLRRLDDTQVAEMIERYIDFVVVGDDGERSVHLQSTFVKHFMQRDDSVLPTIVAVATLPIVLADGGVLGAANGIDRARGIWFEIQNEVRAIVPRPDACDDAAVSGAMNFLTESWLVDVDTDYAGKCSVVAAALSIIERSLLDHRPCFFVTAGRRGGGKTTFITMIIMAATGIWPAASAWSANEDERRKAILSYFMNGAAYILWDNINRGTQISCPHIERSCTSAFYADRKLGVSEMVATAASAIHFFTGNNIAPRGDLASRSLHIRLVVDRPDPENRAFQHPDPIGWTQDHRAKILGALYTVLLGNPMLKRPRGAACKTRFKTWWRLVGSAVEHAAKLCGEVVDFTSLFLDAEEGEDEAAALAEALQAMFDEWGHRHVFTFQASEVADLINDQSVPLNPHGLTLRDFLYPGQPAGFKASARGTGKRLRLYVDNPVENGSNIMTLKGSKNRVGINEFTIQVA